MPLLYINLEAFKGMTRSTEPAPECGPSQPTFEVCIDESGDDGMNCKCGEWMILSAFVSLRANYRSDIELVRGVKREIEWKERKPLHFRDLPIKGKRLVIQHIADQKRRLRVISVLLHKPSLDPGESAWYEEKHRVYFYLVRYLLERVSWSCRDSISIHNRSIGDGTARVVFSAREDLSYADLTAYFGRLQGKDTRIEWRVIRPNQFKVLKNGKHPGLQLADAVASGLYCCDHHCDHKRTAEWAKMLKSVTYHHKGKYLGYGIKLFPSKAEYDNKMAQTAVWAKEIFESPRDLGSHGIHRCHHLCRWPRVPRDCSQAMMHYRRRGCNETIVTMYIGVSRFENMSAALSPSVYFSQVCYYPISVTDRWQEVVCW